MEELAEGHLLSDRYLLGPAVGYGAMGQVHLAEDTRLARPVAVKSLRPELARYPDVRQRFGQEARAAARISHPNVVRVYDSGEEGHIPYLVMECLPGSTLADELAWGPLEPRRVRRVGLDVLGALDAAHGLGIVHRDVKPGNILLSAALDGPLKVSDFGIAKSTDDHELTDSGAMVGTAAYLAPERVAGEAAGPKSDIYSLGVVLYEAVAGRKPYEGETSLAIALAIHMGGAPRLLELQPDLDPRFAEVVERALARDPAERWLSATDMAEALRAWRPGAGEQGAAGEARAVAVPAPAADLSTVALPVDAAADAAGDAAAGVTTDVSLPTTRPGAAGSNTSSLPRRLPTVTGPPPLAIDDHELSSDSRRRRRRTGVLCAGAAALLLVVVVGALAIGRGGGPSQPVTPSTTVAVAAPTTVAVASTLDRSRTSVAPTTVRRPVAPATTAAPRTTIAATTTAPATTARPSTTTTPPATVPPTASTTVPPAASAGPPPTTGAVVPAPPAQG